MKKYCLVIDTSAFSGDENLFVFYANTIKACRQKLMDLKLRFGLGYIYCATVGRKDSGCDNKQYRDILRTDDGYFWRREPLFKFSDMSAYCPESWRSVDSWYGVSDFQRVV